MRIIKTLGALCVALGGIGLVTPAYSAAGNTVRVTLPEAVSVGNATLEGGQQYEISEVSAGAGASLFVIRSDEGDTVAVAAAMKTAGPATDQKTEVVLSRDDAGSLHLDKLFVEGESTGYRFINAK